MNKLLLLVLLIFVQSKKLNIFQESHFRNLDNEEQIEILRQNEELKKIAYTFYDLFDKSADNKEIIAAMNAHYERAEAIIKDTIPETEFIFDYFSRYSNEELVCAISDEKNELKNEIKDLIDSFYQKKQINFESKANQLLLPIAFKLNSCDK